MRITTQMLNASMRKAGLPVSNVSLLNYINGNNSQGNSLLQALNKNGITANHKGYEKQKSQAEKLQQTMDALSSSEIYEEAAKSGDTSTVLSSVKEMVTSYNEMIKSLKSASSPLDQYYRQMLTEAAEDAKGRLKEIGITRGRDGALSLDEDILKSSGTDKIREVLAGDGSFTAKGYFLAGRIAGNAQANAASVSSQYDVMGNQYFASASKYDFWG